MSHQIITDAIATSYQELREYAAKTYSSAMNEGVDAAARWVRQLTWEMARLIVAEEILVYPLYEKYLGEVGKRVADEDRAEHQKVKELLYDLESFSVASQSYHTSLDKFLRIVATRGVPWIVLSGLERSLGAEGSKELVASFNRTKKFVPTSAQPGAQDKPPFETLADFLTAPADKLKDILAKFPTEETKEEAEKHEEGGECIG